MSTALTRWMLTEGRSHGTVEAVLAAWGTRLREVLPLDRIWLGTKVLHPQAAAWAWTWEPGAAVRSRSISYEYFAADIQNDSPARRLERGAPFVRLTRDSPDIPDDSRPLFEGGVTELYGLTLTFRGRWRGAITYSTRHPDGFTAEQRELLDATLPAFNAVFESLGMDLVMGELLRTYLGRDAGRRVHHGAVKRGDATTRASVVWFSDVKGFTALAEQTPRDTLIALLNQSFEIVVRSVRAHGGEVLKFMGDGTLVRFDIGDDDPDGVRTCAAALRAALDVRASHEAWSRDPSTQPALQVGIGLHFGSMSYGNIGAPGRLDFTVIGSAVNRTARIESLGRITGEDILASDAFRNRAGGRWHSCGTHEVKGVPEPISVHAPRPSPALVEEGP